MKLAHGIIEKLPPPHKEVVTLKHGIGGSVYTYNAIAAILKITAEKVQELEQEALEMAKKLVN